MELPKSYFYIGVNAVIIIILFFKWQRYIVSKSAKKSFFNCFYYGKYDMINSRNYDSKKNKVLQNNLTFLLVFFVFIEIFLKIFSSLL
jgi:hypothetical protein